MDDKSHSASTQAGPPVAPQLEIIQGENPGETFKLKRITTIGRERDNDITLLDLKASRYHAQITFEAGQWLLQDLGSVNGTLLNDTSLTAPTPLQNSDQITVGETKLAFRTSVRSAAAPSAVTSTPVPSSASTKPAQPTSSPAARTQAAKPPRLAWIAGGLILLVCFAAVFAIYLITTRIDVDPEGEITNVTPPPSQENNAGIADLDDSPPPKSGQPVDIPTELTLVYEDDFSDSFGGWDDAFDTYTRKVYGNNRYQIEVNTSNLVAWGLANRDIADFEIEVEARQEDGDPSASYGLLFRFEDRENFYRFDVSGDGFFLLSKFINGQWVTLIDWTESEFINPGSTGNLLKVSAFGPNLTIWANGQQLATLTDNSLTHGNFGLFVGTFGEPFTWVSYDNLKLWTPPGQQITLIPTATRPSAAAQSLSLTATSTLPPPASTPTSLANSPISTPESIEEPTSTPRPTAQPPTPTPEPLPEYASRDQTLARGEQEIAGRIVFPIFDPERGIYDIYIADIADGNNLQLIQANASQPGLNLDGTEFAYRSWQADRRGLFARPLNGDDLNAWGFDLFFESARPQFSPIDNSLMYFSRTGGDAPATYRVIDAVGQVMRREGFPIQGKSPKWASNGQQFVYSSCLASDCGIILSNIDGSTPLQLTNHPSDTNPEVSPDGAILVFMSERGGNWEIYRAGIDGSSVTALTTDSASDGLPTWSPDGSKIAFLSNRDGQWALWTMDPNGSNKRRHFVLPGSVDGIVQHDIANSFGWLEENLDWIP